MITANPRAPLPINEPIKQYAPGSAERTELKAALTRVGAEKLEIPVVIGGKEVRTGKTFEVRSPFDHHKVLATVHAAGPEQVSAAITSALSAKKAWAELPLSERSAVMLKAAELLATKYRAQINAVTMWGQAKTAFQEVEIGTEPDGRRTARLALARDDGPFVVELHDASDDAFVLVVATVTPSFPREKK